MIIDIILDDTTKTISQEELFDLAKQGTISPGTNLLVDGKLITADKVEGIVFCPDEVELDVSDELNPFVKDVSPFLLSIPVSTPNAAMYRKDAKLGEWVRGCAFVFWIFCLIGTGIISQCVFGRGILSYILTIIIGFIPVVIIAPLLDIFFPPSNVPNKTGEKTDEWGVWEWVVFVIVTHFFGFYVFERGILTWLGAMILGAISASIVGALIKHSRNKLQNNDVCDNKCSQETTPRLRFPD